MPSAIIHSFSSYLDLRNPIFKRWIVFKEFQDLKDNLVNTLSNQISVILHSFDLASETLSTKTRDHHWEGTIDASTFIDPVPTDRLTSNEATELSSAEAVSWPFDDCDIVNP